MLGKTPVSYLHLPLAIDGYGNKLSKQNHATAIDLQQPKSTLIRAMQFLGLSPTEELQQASIDELLLWGTENWSIDTLPVETKITTPFSNESL